MWSFLNSFFRNKNKFADLTLENAYSLLENSSTTPTEKVLENIKGNNGKNEFLSKSGTVTNILDNKFVIDHHYICDKSLVLFKLEVDLKVSYDIIISEGKEKVLKVSLVDNEWDVAENKTQLWNVRVLICKVEQRNERKLYLSPGDIEVDLSNVSIEFLPVTGDWLELEVKCTINENSVDLLGNIIEIDKILPIRPHVALGTISSWNCEEGTGIINKNIFYTINSLSCGYIPVVGDKVIAQIIESEQKKCSWRALQVLPECLNNKTENLVLENINTIDFVSEQPGIIVNGLNIYFNNLNTIRYFPISILNNSEKNILLEKVEVLNSNSQCKILESNVDIIITMGSEYKINCQCTAKNIGMSKDFLLLSFKEFSIGKWININVSSKGINDYNQQKTYEHKSKPNRRKDFFGNQVVRGQVAFNSRFMAVRIPFYTVPQKLLNFFDHYDYERGIVVILEELRMVKPVLFSNLSYTNYEDKFHTLLHLDEIAILLAIRNYDQEKACFIMNEEFLMLEIENLSERRPSIVLGDKIHATDPLNETKIDYEGIVHKVSAKHVYLKFSPLFHEQYNGEDYSIRVVPGRQSYRKLHHAIYLATRSLGGEILFPSRLIIKDSQLKFKFEPSSVEDSHVSSPSMENIILLEWFNKKLNFAQQNAVNNVLRGTTRPLPYIIFGPPGTGKTVTLIEIILQIVRSLPQSRYVLCFCIIHEP